MNQKSQFPMTITQIVDDFMVAQLNYINPPISNVKGSYNKSVNVFDDEYHALCETILLDGVLNKNRTATDSIAIFGHLLKFDLKQGFPLITTKKVNFKHLANEILWLYSDKCDNVYNLPEESRFLWKNWAKEDGYLGNIYGMNVRKLKNNEGAEPKYIDQLTELIEGLKTNPNSRRHVITNWIPTELDNQALACCHGNIVQFNVFDNKLSCHMHQRSMDVPVGGCWNIAQYALLTHIIAKCTGYEPDILTISIGNAHIYVNQIEGIKEQLTRTSFPPPKLKINTNKINFDDFTPDDFELINYQHGDFIRFEVAI